MFEMPDLTCLCSGTTTPTAALCTSGENHAHCWDQVRMVWQCVQCGQYVPTIVGASNATGPTLPLSPTSPNPSTLLGGASDAQTFQIGSSIE